jgi:hypothetical protein
VLRFGAPGRLEGVEILPLDDPGLLEKAKPVRNGKFELDKAAAEARHDAQVKAALESGPVSLLMLGGGHHLAPSGRRRGGKIEYIRVMTRRVQEFAGEVGGR